VQHYHDRRSAIRELSDQNYRPQRSLLRQRFHDHGESGVKQSPLVSWGSARHGPDVLINIEVTIIHTHRMPTANRHLDQPLP